MPAVSQSQREALNAKFGHGRKTGWKNTPEYCKRLSESRMGHKNPMWKHGPLTPQQKSDYSRQWRKQNEEYVRDKEYRKRFGITLEEYDALLDYQKGVCAICEQPCERGRLCVDHCHTTGKVRGLLCRKCNIFLGQIGDNLDWIRKAEQYLCHSKARNSEGSCGKITLK